MDSSGVLLILVSEVGGWSEPGEHEALEAAARELDGPYMEIGTYAGRSAVRLGQVARERGTTLFCVDHHRGPPEVWGSPGMVGEDGRHDSLPSLRRNLADAGLEDTVIPIVASSQAVAGWWSLPVSLLFLDGACDMDGALHDYTKFSPFITSNGILAIHDANSERKSIADQAVKDSWKQITQVGSLMMFINNDTKTGDK